MADPPGPRRMLSATCRRPPRRTLEPPAPSANLAVHLPADYTAFCMLYQDRYLRYARARIVEPGMSRELVEIALGSIATNWAAMLTSHRPAAQAWSIFGCLIAEAVRRQAAPTGCNALYRVLPLPQADAVLLRYRLSLSNEQAADLMGVEEPVVAYQLKMARRRMAEHTTCTWPTAPSDQT